MDKQIPQCYQCKYGLNGCELGRIIILNYAAGYGIQFRCPHFETTIVTQERHKEVVA